MKRIGIAAFIAVGLLWGTGSCVTKNKIQTQVDNNQELKVTGKITAIETGKDGYVATVKDNNGQLYDVMISIVNLQKSGSQYKAHKTGDVITVQGPRWTDTEGRVHITAHQLK